MREGLTATLALLAATPAGAETLTVDYGLWLAGLPIGSAQVNSVFEGTQYRLLLKAKLSGLAGAITGGQGSATAAGSVSSARPTPASFAVTARNSGFQRTIRMAMNGGNVAGVDIDPPWEPKPGRVPVLESHKRAIVDPLSGLVLGAVSRGPLTDPSNCERTVPIFDGASRYDIVMSYAGTRAVEKPGYSGPVIVCNVRFVPLGGYRPDGPSTRFMIENRDMDVWLAPIEKERVLFPLRISVKTQIGTSVVEATRWSVHGNTAIPIAAQGTRNPKGQ